MAIFARDVRSRPSVLNASPTQSPERTPLPVDVKHHVHTTENEIEEHYSKNGRKNRPNHLATFFRRYRNSWVFLFATVFVLTTWQIIVAPHSSEQQLRPLNPIFTYPDTAAATAALSGRRRRKHLQNINKRPHFILHIGPPKSATTSLQYDLTHYQDSLLQDNYVYLGNEMHNPDNMWDHGHAPLLNLLLHRGCMKAVNTVRVQKKKYPRQYRDAEYPPCWYQLQNILQEYRNNGQSIILSEEFLSMRYVKLHSDNDDEDDPEPSSIDWAALSEVLFAQDWEPIVLVGYRRLFDILPSAKQQWDRYYKGNYPLTLWPSSQGGRPLEPLFPNVLSDPRLYDAYTANDVRSKEIIHWSYTDHLVHSIAPYVPVRMLNIHEPRVSLRTNLFCHVLPATEHACVRAQEDTTKDVHNAEESLYFDALACRAEARGLVDGAVYNRRSVSVAVREYHGQELSKDQPELAEFPLTCPSNESTMVLLERSLVKEEQLWPKVWVDRWREDHIAHFHKNRDKHKFCWIDADQALEQEHWQAFFRHLDFYVEKYASEEQNGDDDDSEGDDANTYQQIGNEQQPQQQEQQQQEGNWNNQEVGGPTESYTQGGGQQQKGFTWRYEEGAAV